MWWPFKTKRRYVAHIEQPQTANRDERERQQHEDQIQIVRALNRIRDQLATDEQEEQRDHTKKAFREWATIILIFATVVATGVGDWFFYGQLREMQDAGGQTKELVGANAKLAEAAAKQAEAADKQAGALAEAAKLSRESMIASSRAWVGPRNAKIEGAIEIGKPVEFEIEYVNSGKEPALDFIYRVEPFTATQDEDTSGVVIRRIGEYFEACQRIDALPQGGVVFPSLGFSANNLTAKTTSDIITQSLLDGDVNLIVQGCFLYKSFNVIRHSYFCYYYNAKRTKVANLNICTAGHYAD
jgi:hypothetical protein